MKRIVLSLLLVLFGLVLLWALSAKAGGFADRASCVVQGYVYANPGEPSSFHRVDLCTDVKAEVLEGNLLHMYSSYFWVDLVLPTSGGHQVFLYRWRAPVAHIGPVVWPIAYGPLKAG